jgi:hypothetical protein
MTSPHRAICRKRSRWSDPPARDFSPGTPVADVAHVPVVNTKVSAKSVD